MENKYIYIDESGDTGYTKKSTRYFILTALIVDDIFVLRRIAKKVHKSKVNKKKSSMLHAYKETNRVRDRLVKEIKSININCIVFVLDKKEKQVKDSYFYLLEKLAKYFSKIKVTQIVLAKKETRSRYNQKIIDMFKSYDIDLILSIPIDEKSLQIADFYSWAVFVYLEYGQCQYFNQLENHTVFR